ncbi:1,3-beta-glucanosyltransferase [Favolaschia claudopus]|uniref:1,3-beta-glucanosyltransferase n=1 Tax=Favolaschia claudopus TaxID=2862362 RepID=A0AAW0BPX7_9AGAR
MRGLLFSYSLLLATTTTTTFALPQITRTGRYLYKSDDNSRFYVKGIAYQQQGLIISGPDNPLNQPSTFVDQLADSAGCSRDIPVLQKLGVNAIRAYSVDASLNHDACMSALDAAGIYVILDLTLPLNGSIDTTQPTWSTNLLDQYTTTITAFSRYPNVLAYNIGNEVLTNGATNAAPFLKAATRDTRAFLKSINSTALIGYADIDGASAFRDGVAQYLSCDPSNSGNGDTSIDLFGLNNYAWCGNASSSTYDNLNAEFENYNVAAYFSEFGSENCNPGTRPWSEVGTLFASPMTNIWSGGLAFSYFPATSAGHEFGMATLSGSSNETVTTNADFSNLASQFSSVQFVNSPSKDSVQASSFGACPQTGVQASTTLPPTPNDSGCACVAQRLACRFKVPGGDYNAVLGTLTGTVCGLLAGVNGTCGDIAANGTTGVYGAVAMCDPVTRLSYAFSQYYDLTARHAASCDFDGNATLDASATDSPASALSACISNPSAISTPSAPAGVSAPSSSASGAGGGGGGGGGGSGAGRTRVGLVGVLVVVGCVLGGVGMVL